MSKLTDKWYAQGFRIVGNGVSRNWKVEADDLEKALAEKYAEDGIATEVFIHRAGGSANLVEYDVWGKPSASDLQSFRPEQTIENILELDNEQEQPEKPLSYLIEYYLSRISGKWVIKVHDQYDELVDLIYFVGNEKDFATRLDAVTEKYQPSTVEEVEPISRMA